MTVVGIGRYRTLPLDEDLDGLDSIPALCIQDCIVLSFKKLQERHAENPTTVRNNEPALDPFAESIDLLLSHKLKNKKNSFWNLVKEISFNDVVQTISNLSYVTTNAGKARAWIYLAIQDQLLQCYLTQLTEDRKLLSKFYKADAAICDQEMMFSISSLFSGLEVMTFDISIDCPSFDLGVAPSFTSMAMEGAQRALWGASSNLTDIGESINESVAMHMPYLFKGAPGVLDGKDSSRLVVGTVPSHYSSTPSINSFDSLECSSLNSLEEERNASKRGSIAAARRGIKAKRKNRKDRTGLTSEVTDQFATTDFVKGEFNSNQTDVASTSEPAVTETASGPSGLFSEDVVGSCDVLTLMADKLQEASRTASPSLQPKVTAVAYLRQMNSTLSADKDQTLANVVDFNENANVDKAPDLNKVASTDERSRTTLVAPLISVEPPFHSLTQNRTNLAIEDANNADALSLAESANGSDNVLDYEETPGRERRNDTFFKGEEIDGVRVIQVDLGALESSGSSHISDSSSTQHHNTIPSSSNRSGSTVVGPDTSKNGAQNLNSEVSLHSKEPADGQVKFEESNASAFISSMFADIASSPPDTETVEQNFQLVTEKVADTDQDELRLESSLAVSNWLFSDGELSNSYSNVDSSLTFKKESDRNKTNKNAAPARPNDLQFDRQYEEIEHAEVEDSVDELALLGTGIPTTNMPPSPLDPMDVDAKRSSLANILSATLYMENNAVGQVSESSHKGDLFIDHMMKLSFELKVYQFNQDGEEEPIKLYRGFYRHMEMPSSWTRNAYHARPIDLLLTSRCLYFLKFDGEKADSLHYFFPLDEISLITTYPFEQGIKFFSRRPDEAEWAKLTMHDNKRINEFWFETGDSHFTQQIIKKLKETISVYWSETHSGSIHHHPQQQPQFGAEPIMELAQLSSFMAFTFNYEGESKQQVRLFSLVFMGESPSLEEDFLFQSGGSGTHTPRSAHSANGTSDVRDSNDNSSHGSGHQVSYDGILWSKEDASSNLVGGFIRKPSLTLVRNTVWRDYHFSIRNGVLYKAEYMSGGKISQPEMVVSLAECSSCKMYRDSDKPYTFLLTSSKANQGLAKLLQNSRAGSRLLAPITSYSFAARNERDATEWIYAIRKFLPSSSGQRSKGRLIPVKAGALVVDNFNAAVCRYEREREEFYAMEKFSLLNISRVITPTDLTHYKSDTLIADEDDLELGMRMLSAPEVELLNTNTRSKSNPDLNYVIIDFQPTAEAKGEEDDDFEIVENTNLVDNLLPMVLYFCCEREAASFVSIIQDIVSHATIQSLPVARLSSYVTRSLEKTQTDINRTRMLNKY